MTYLKINEAFVKEMDKLKNQQNEKRLQELESAYLQANRKYRELAHQLHSITPKHEGQLFQGLPGLVNFPTLQSEAKAALIARDKARVALEGYSIAPEAPLVQQAVIQMACLGMQDGALLPILAQETSKRRIPAAVKDQPFALYKPRRPRLCRSTPNCRANPMNGSKTNGALSRQFSAALSISTLLLSSGRTASWP